MISGFMIFTSANGDFEVMSTVDVRDGTGIVAGVSGNVDVVVRGEIDGVVEVVGRSTNDCSESNSDRGSYVGGSLDERKSCKCSRWGDAG